MTLTAIEEPAAIVLSLGVHKSREEGMCFMEAVAYVAGEEHTSIPECACIVSTWFAALLNDYMTDELRNQLLPPLIPAVVGSHTDDRAVLASRSTHLVRGIVLRILPRILRLDNSKDAAIAVREIDSLEANCNILELAYTLARLCSDLKYDREATLDAVTGAYRGAESLKRAWMNHEDDRWDLDDAIDHTVDGCSYIVNSVQAYINRTLQLDPGETHTVLADILKEALEITPVSLGRL